VTWAQFALQILPDLVQLARELFKRHGGDIEAARLELRNIHSRKAEIEADRAKIDAEIEIEKLKGSPK
jgi:hypothetical protein